MSRIGKQPVAIPGGVKVHVADGTVRVEGPKGKLELQHHPAIKVESDGTTRAPRPFRSSGPTTSARAGPCTA